MTLTYTCVNGVCTPGSSKCSGVVCGTDASCAITTCNAPTGFCSFAGYTNTSVACTSANPLLRNETCDGRGTCRGVPLCTGVQCPPPTRCRTTSVCELTSGHCLSTLTPGASCNDGNVSTVDDKCDVTGVCLGVDPCLNVTCLEHRCLTRLPCAFGVCRYTLMANGTSCDDGDLLTVNDVCNGGGRCRGVDGMLFICIYIYICACVCVIVYIYIYICVHMVTGTN